MRGELLYMSAPGATAFSGFDGFIVPTMMDLIDFRLRNNGPEDARRQWRKSIARDPSGSFL